MSQKWKIPDWMKIWSLTSYAALMIFLLLFVVSALIFHYYIAWLYSLAAASLYMGVDGTSDLIKWAVRRKPVRDYALGNDILLQFLVVFLLFGVVYSQHITTAVFTAFVNFVETPVLGAMVGGLLTLGVAFSFSFNIMRKSDEYKNLGKSKASNRIFRALLVRISNLERELTEQRAQNSRLRLELQRDSEEKLQYDAVALAKLAKTKK